MITADWIAIGLVAVFALIGAIAGFGGGLRFFTKGIFGVIISVIVCYFLLGIVLSWEFVQDLMAKLNTAIVGDGENGFLVWLVDSAAISKIICAVLLFIVVQFIRIILVKALRSVFEAPNAFCRVINKTLGMVLFVAALLTIALIAASIISWVGGSTESNLLSDLSGSALRLDYLYYNNPLSAIFN